MPDIETSERAQAAEKGIGDRIRGLFTRNDIHPSTPGTPADRLKDLQHESKDSATLTGKDAARRAPWVSMAELTRQETIAIITAATDRATANDFIDRMNEAEEAVIELGGGVKLFGKTGEALAHDDAQRHGEPGSYNAGRSGGYRELLQLNYTDKNIDVAYDILRDAGLDPRKTVEFRNLDGQISMDDLTPKEDSYNDAQLAALDREDNPNSYFERQADLNNDAAYVGSLPLGLGDEDADVSVRRYAVNDQQESSDPGSRVLPPITGLPITPKFIPYSERDHSSTLVISPSQFIDLLRQLETPEREIAQLVTDMDNHQKFWHALPGVDASHDETEWGDGRFGMELELMGSQENINAIRPYLREEPGSETFWYDRAIDPDLDEEIDAAVQHDLKIFHGPEEPNSPEIEAAIKHDLEIFQGSLREDGAPSHESLDTDRRTYSGDAQDKSSISNLAERIHDQHEPIDPELDDTYYNNTDNELSSNPANVTSPHVCGPNCNCAAASGGRKVSVQQALIELAASQGAEHTTNAAGNAVLTGADAESILRAVQIQAAAAEAAIQKALREKQKQTDIEDAALDDEQTRGGKEPIALKLTEEQVQLLVSNEYPNEPEKASQSVYKLIRDGEPVNILKESVQLDYSEDIKGFYARLDEAERPALLSKLQDLEKQDEREKRAPEQQRQKARSKDRERE